MFNPLAILDQKALEGMVADGHRYFVRQTFHREPYSREIRASFIVCHYKDLPKAKEHYNVLEGDPNRFLYDWEDLEHRRRLLVAASGPEGYRIFTNTLVPNWEDHLTPQIREKIKAYIMKLGWKPTREETVIPVLYPHFGEICVSLRFRKQEVRVTFDEIEKAF